MRLKRIPYPMILVMHQIIMLHIPKMTKRKMVGDNITEREFDIRFMQSVCFYQ